MNDGGDALVDGRQKRQSAGVSSRSDDRNGGESLKESARLQIGQAEAEGEQQIPEKCCD